MQQGQMKRLADGGNVTSFVTGGEVNDEGRVMGSDGQEYLVSAGYQPGDTLGGATVFADSTPDESLSGTLGLSPRAAPPQKTGITAGETATSTPIVEQPTEQIDPITVGTTPTTALSTASEVGLSVAKPQAEAASTYTAYTVPGTPEAIAAQGTLSQESKIGDIQGTVSQEALAAAAQGTVSEKATVKYQLGQLFDSIKTGEELPAWAAPAVRNVTAQMQARGLGASSMAAAAITQSLMEAGIPIAATDAKTYATMDLQNLNNSQQTALQNAMTYAAMDKANLDARMTAAVNNAKSFLTMDTQNLTNAQQSNALSHQSHIQKLFTNQAQDNAALQFNAKSQNQITEFFSELGVQVENANLTRVAAMRQFNADQGNATSRFVSQMEDSRDKFNSNMAAQIDQSNANWRRQINTQNTATQNENTRINAQNLLGISVQAQNQLWQRYRDEAQWSLQRAESSSNRSHAFAMQSQQNDFSIDTYETEYKDNMYMELGTAIYNKVFG
tara:strand:- start:2420 stop:3922 length:1503 start_codon:yes stop_codon:yes gene_type:complete